MLCNLILEAEIRIETAIKWHKTTWLHHLDGSVTHSSGFYYRPDTIDLHLRALVEASSLLLQWQLQLCALQ